jgi:signal transduction histidine kinase
MPKAPLSGRGCAMLVRVDVDELQHALGGVVLEAAYMERVLRTAFSALVGSKYAAVVDGRLTAAALIEDCERITRYHTAITHEAKEGIWTALRACHEANKDRNRVIHDTWATRPGSVMVTLQGSRTSHDITVTVRTLAEVRQLGDQLANAAHELRTAMTTALGPDWALLEDQLRRELGRDIGADLGR